jgi:ceramide glucosyltransferase
VLIFVLFLFSLLSLALTLWRWLVSLLFPLHQPLKTSKTTPAITVLKPLKGVETETHRCLKSWLELRYPGPLQILFGVASPDDPVCGIVRELLASHPGVNARLVICPEILGPNRKVSTLMQLEKHIEYSLVFISDADVWVKPGFLESVTPYFERPGTGLVNCFYRYANPGTLPMLWESVGVNADFWSQVLQARSLKDADFALGAVMALPLSRLKEIGGFGALVHYLADDYHLGRKVAASGGEIIFAQEPVDCFETQRSWGRAWDHQLRWARTIRVCQAVPYFFSILNNATFWPLLLLLASLCGDRGSGDAAVPVVCVIAVTIRILSAFYLQWRLLERNPGLVGALLAPVKDLLDVVIWAISFLGNTIEWRGDHYRILKDGDLERID